MGMRVPATPKADVRSAPVIQTAGHSDANIVRGTRIDTAQIALLDLDTFAARINARPNGPRD